MNLIDLIIIYLACGSPFGVYFFFNNKSKTTTIWFISFLVALFWIPFAISILYKKATSRLKVEESYEDTDKLHKLQKDFENYISKYKSDTSLFEFREVFERYRELTIIVSEIDNKPADYQKELFRISGDTAVDVSALCLNRRNREKLISHQKNAREDFLDILSLQINRNPELINLRDSAFEFVSILKDELAFSKLQFLFDEDMQIDKEPTVNHWETELWKPKEQLLLKEKQISIPMQTLSMTANIPKKD